MWNGTINEEKVRINTLGNVGIGTGNPAGLLHLSSTGTTRMFIEGNNGRNEIRGSNGNLSFFANQDANASGANNIIFYRDGSIESMRISTDGFLGMGTTSPQRPLHIKDPNAALRLQDADGTNQLTEIIQQNGITYFDNRNNTGGGSHVFRTFNGTSPETKVVFKPNGSINIANCPTFADDSAAGTGGLVAGDVYKTSTGELRIKL